MSTNKDTVGGKVGSMLGGLVFLKTRIRPQLVEFYTTKLRMKVWLEQPNITILSHGNFLIGFHQKEDESPEVSGMYTLVYPSKQGVDETYETLKDIADGRPRTNPTYRIYQFFARDPEGRALEFQAFLHPLRTVSSDPKQIS